MPASSVQRNHWFHIERGNSARGPDNKPDQFKPVHDDLSPTGARRGVSISTVTVCDFDDFSGSYTNVDDVCSLGGR